MNDNERTPSSCFEQMRPIITEVIHLTKKAPLTSRGRAGLALLVFAAFRTNAAIAIQEMKGTVGDKGAFDRAFAEVCELTGVVTEAALAAAKEET